jgi:hypothetical protein
MTPSLAAPPLELSRTGKLPDARSIAELRLAVGPLGLEAWLVRVRQGGRGHEDQLALVEASEAQTAAALEALAPLRRPPSSFAIASERRPALAGLGYQLTASPAQEEAASAAADRVCAALPRLQEVTQLLGEVGPSPGGAGAQLRLLMGQLRPAVEALPDKQAIGDGALAIRALLEVPLCVPHLDGHATRDIAKRRFHVGRTALADGESCLATQLFSSRAAMGRALGAAGTGTAYDIVTGQQVIDSFDPDLLLHNPGFSLVVDLGSERWFRLPALLMLLLGQAKGRPAVATSAG